MSLETSEYTNAIDIWALGCITHEILTQTLPFRGWGELSSYCSRPSLPRNAMLSKNISKRGIEFVERALAYPPVCRMAANEALGLEWLRPEDTGAAGLETEDWAGSAFPEGSSQLHPGWTDSALPGDLQREGSRIGAPTLTPQSPPIYFTHNVIEKQPLTAQPPPLGVPCATVRLVTVLLAPKGLGVSAIGHIAISLLQWAWTLCEALAVNGYFPAVTIFVVWSLFSGDW